MGWLQNLVRGRPPLPTAAKNVIPREERVLAWAEALTGQIVVATDRALHVIGASAHRAIGWSEISKGTWDGHRLTVIETKKAEQPAAIPWPEGAEVDEIVDRAPWSLEFDEPGLVPMKLRDRVESAVVVSVYRDLPTGSVLIIGRKVPGRNGLVWQYRAEPGTDLSDLETLQALYAAVETERIKHTPTDL
ncbi:hypothetical protein EK0264_02760 [Epidermidibacterium keratini]|uniref:Uncharacterized protein n=1 Tax=Epidermidibacterium keratini TaxID=1891644 RepID=A0A7L4YJ15_9ACTN|nr:hypothetical protein [Epidermidibacterium keratini]QHB99314.1 hypothetical protein EK0264_02760 [Epidermidibacterium keratini]